MRAPAPLPEEIQQELKQRKSELLPLLEALAWLRVKLSTPQHIASLVAEWAGERDGATGWWIDDLMEARWALRVESYAGEDSRLWWRLPHETVQ